MQFLHYGLSAVAAAHTTTAAAVAGPVAAEASALHTEKFLLNFYEFLFEKIHSTKYSLFSIQEVAL